MSGDVGMQQFPGPRSCSHGHSNDLTWCSVCMRELTARSRSMLTPERIESARQQARDAIAGVAHDHTYPFQDSRRKCLCGEGIRTCPKLDRMIDLYRDLERAEAAVQQAEEWRCDCDECKVNPDVRILTAEAELERLVAAALGATKG